MPDISALAADQMQNVYTPLPVGAHFVFCILATLVYLAQFYRRKSVHYLLLMIAVDLTFVTQINTSKAMLTCLFIAEAALLISALVISIKNKDKVPDAKNVKTEYPEAPSVETEHPDVPDVASEYPDAPDAPSAEEPKDEGDGE